MTDTIIKTEDPHRQLYKLLCGKIADGTYPAHTRLPAERALAEQYGLSQVTVNKAIKQLEAQGLVYTRRGVGVFASAAAREYSLNRLHSFHDWCAASGRVPGTETACVRLATDADKERFRGIKGYADGAYVYLVRKRFMDGEPAIFEERLVNGALFGVDDLAAMGDSYFAFLATRLPVPLHTSQRVMKLVEPDADAGAFLRLERGERGVRISGCTRDMDEELVDFDILTYHPDRFEFNYILSH